MMWSPVLVSMDHRRFVLRKTVGYLPPLEMLAELRFVSGLYELRQARPSKAIVEFKLLASDYPGTSIVPEAAYWEGIAAYRTSKDKEDLWVIWRRLIKDYPDSVWAAKTTLLD